MYGQYSIFQFYIVKSLNKKNVLNYIKYIKIYIILLLMFQNRNSLQINVSCIGLEIKSRNSK